MKQRELKFRAWDKEHKKMRTDFVVAPTSPTWAPFLIRYDEEANSLLNALDKKRGDLLGGHYTTHDWGDYYAIENFTVMQFTGLKDRYGKEVFEGDLVTLYAEDGSPVNHKYTVEWIDHGFKLVHAKPDYNRLEWGGIHRVNELGWTIEIIGNLFEHP